MSRPLLPSQRHPDYPKPATKGGALYGPSPAEYAAFFRSHPEFMSEGEYHLCCPYCGCRLGEPSSACCGEAGHGEWVYLDDRGRPAIPPDDPALRDIDFIKATLANDEASTDEELVAHLVGELNLPEEEARQWLLLRPDYAKGTMK